MTKKAASMKPKKSVSEERTPEEYFEEAKDGLILIADVSCKNATRIDNIVNMISYFKEYFDNQEAYEYAIKFCTNKKINYETISKYIKNVTFDDMTAEEYIDPLISFISYRDDYSESLEHTLTNELAAYEAARPFGEKLEQLRITLLEMMDKDIK